MSCPLGVTDVLYHTGPDPLPAPTGADLSRFRGRGAEHRSAHELVPRPGRRFCASPTEGGRGRRAEGSAGEVRPSPGTYRCRPLPLRGRGAEPVVRSNVSQLAASAPRPPKVGEADEPKARRERVRTLSPFRGRGADRTPRTLTASLCASPTEGGRGRRAEGSAGEGPDPLPAPTGADLSRFRGRGAEG